MAITPTVNRRLTSWFIGRLRMSHIRRESRRLPDGEARHSPCHWQPNQSHGRYNDKISLLANASLLFMVSLCPRPLFLAVTSNCSLKSGLQTWAPQDFRSPSPSSSYTASYFPMPSTSPIAMGSTVQSGSSPSASFASFASQPLAWASRAKTITRTEKTSSGPRS